MKTIAEFAVRRRWLVIVGWLVLIVAAQGIAGAMGGSAYKDTFSLPQHRDGQRRDAAQERRPRQPERRRRHGRAQEQGQLGVHRARRRGCSRRWSRCAAPATTSR